MPKNKTKKKNFPTYLPITKIGSGMGKQYFLLQPLLVYNDFQCNIHFDTGLIMSSARS